MDFMSAAEAADKWEISKRRVELLCQTGRIDGVSKFGNSWLIPNSAQKPADARIKSGKYRKKPGGDHDGSSN